MPVVPGGAQQYRVKMLIIGLMFKNRYEDNFYKG